MSNLKNELEDDLRYISPGHRAEVQLPSGGAKWDPVTGWSGTPGTGEAPILAVHEDGSLDVQVQVWNGDPRRTLATLETFTRVPHVSKAERIELLHRHSDGTPIASQDPHEVTGPCWWVNPNRKPAAR